MLLPRRMLGRNVERAEIVPVGLDVRPLGDRKTHVAEDRDHLLPDLGDRDGRCPSPPGAAGSVTSTVSVLSRASSASSAKHVAARLDVLRDRVAELVQRRAGGLALLRAHRAEPLQALGDRAFLAERRDAQRLERRARPSPRRWRRRFRLERSARSDMLASCFTGSIPDSLFRRMTGRRSGSLGVAALQRLRPVRHSPCRVPTISRSCAPKRWWKVTAANQQGATSMRSPVARVVRRSVRTTQNMVSQIVVSVAAAVCVAFITNAYLERRRRRRTLAAAAQPCRDEQAAVATGSRPRRQPTIATGGPAARRSIVEVDRRTCPAGAGCPAQEIFPGVPAGHAGRGAAAEPSRPRRSEGERRRFLGIPLPFRVDGGRSAESAAPPAAGSSRSSSGG